MSIDNQMVFYLFHSK